MKISCCCVTCFIGDPQVEKEEETRLIVEDKKPLKDEQETTIKSPQHTNRRNHLGQKRQTPEVNVSVYEDDNEKSSDEERINRKVQILKKYNVEPTLKQTSEPENIELKIGVKTMRQSGVVKIFILQATNVLYVLQNKSPPESLSEEKIVVQLRTKVIPIEARGHSKKYEIRESVTGNMKFMNECIHEIQFVEIKHLKVRFRIYHVLKKHRDILLSEYILNLGLNLGYDSSRTVNVILPMHEPSATNIRPPTIYEARKSVSSVSSMSTNSGNALFQREVQDVDVESLEETDVEEKDPLARKHKLSVLKQLKEFRRSIDFGSGERSSNTLGVDHLKENSSESSFDKLKHGLSRRSSKISQLENKSDELSSEAKNFSAVSQMLREKYQHK